MWSARPELHRGQTWVAATCLCCLGHEREMQTMRAMKDERDGWTRRESNPCRCRARAASSLLDHEPRSRNHQRHRRESNPPRSDRQSPNVTRQIRRHVEAEPETEGRAFDGNRTRLEVIDSHLTSPDVSEGSYERSSGPHGDSNPDLTRCKRGVLPLGRWAQKRHGRGGWTRTNNLNRSERCVLPIELLPHEAERAGGIEPRFSGLEDQGPRPSDGGAQNERAGGTGARNRT